MGLKRDDIAISIVKKLGASNLYNQRMKAHLLQNLRERGIGQLAIVLVESLLPVQVWQGVRRGFKHFQA